jgi:N,N-dimethylformamidase beta subunit-like, C-terminal/Tachylectin
MPTDGQRPTRRGILVAGGALTVASAAAAVGVVVEQMREDHPGRVVPPVENPLDPVSPPDRYDPEQRYLQLVGGGNGVLYAVQADGKLLWHRHTGWEASTAEWAPGSGRVIGWGWHQYRTVMGAEDGSLWGLRGDGTIVHKRYLLTDNESGAGIWSGEQEVGSGFARFERVFGYDGHIYGISEGGRLAGFKYDPAARRLQGPVAASGGFSAVHYGADVEGVIYTYWDNGLAAYRHTGDGRWANNGGGVNIARGVYEIAEFGAVFFAGAGRVYYSEPADPERQHDGNLRYHRLANYATAATEGKPAWATPIAVPVGTGYTVGPQANLQGYPLTLSAPVGGSIAVAISSTFAELTASVVRLAPSESGPVQVGRVATIPGKLQNLRNGYLHSGCGWESSWQATVAPDWPSGVYAVRVTGPAGLTRHLPFIVRPATPVERTAVIMPTNTYMAYNTWGGHSQYCGCRFMKSKRRTLSFHRPFSYEPTQQGGRVNFTLFADLLLLRWMTLQDIGYDVYSDEDLDRDPGLLKPYQAVVLPTHPEYYSERQREHLLAHQDGGGCTLYLGGNGIYERVSFTADRSGLVFRAASGRRDIYSELNKPASQLLGTNWNPTNYMTFAPYEVVRQHPFLAGTGLKPGATFGLQGLNGPASGGEVDCRMGQQHEVAELDIIARGQNPRRGAEMLMRQGPRGGFLFSAGSVTFTGALFTSDALSRILRNVFDHALK